MRGIPGQDSVFSSRVPYGRTPRPRHGHLTKSYAMAFAVSADQHSLVGPNI